MSLVTVVIVNWNCGGLLEECLQRLERQTVRPDRILLMDNGSTDGSVERVEQQMPAVEVCRLGSNLGFAAANNRALEACDTEWVALLNPDAFPEPDWLASLLEAAQVWPEVAAFGSRQMVHGLPDVIDGLGDVYHISGLAWRSGHGRVQCEADRVGREIFSPCAGAALFRRQALLDVGGFDESFFCYFEDVDLGFRLRLAAYPCAYVPAAVVHHVGSASSGGRHSDFSIYHGHRNLVWTFVKDMPSPLFWLLLPIHVVLNIVGIIYFCVHGKCGPIVHAKWDAIKGLPKAWRQRRFIQAKRRVSAWAIWQAMDKRVGIFGRGHI